MGGFLIERFGYRKSLMGNYVLICPFIAISAFAQNLPMLFVGGLLQGIPFGVFSTLVSRHRVESQYRMRVEADHLTLRRVAMLPKYVHSNFEVISPDGSIPAGCWVSSSVPASPTSSSK